MEVKISSYQHGEIWGKGVVNSHNFKNHFVYVRPEGNWTQFQFDNWSQKQPYCPHQDQTLGRAVYGGSQEYFAFSNFGKSHSAARSLADDGKPDKL